MNRYTPFHQTVPQGDNVVAFPRAQAPQTASVAIVVPCYNEAERLQPGIFSDFLEREPSVSFVFVDDGSKDATLECLAELHETNPGRIHVLALHQNSGKAEAVRQGLLHACATSAAFVGFWDADLATPLEAIIDFARVGERYDDVSVVFGARRMLLGHQVNRTMSRRAVSRACASLARMAVRLPIGDTQCGAKLLRNTPSLTEALQDRFTAGWLFDVELFTRLAARSDDPHRSFYEYPLAEWTEVAGSKVSAKAIIMSGFAMLRLIGEARMGVAARAYDTAPVGVDVVCEVEQTIRKAA